MAQIVCSGCKKSLGQKEVAEVAGVSDPVTHGMCEKCIEKYYGDILEKRSDDHAAPDDERMPGGVSEMRL